MKTTLLISFGLLPFSAAAQPAAGASFIKVTTGAIVTDGGSSYGCSWGDYDDDGRIDLFVANAWGQQSFLYRNIGSGEFEKVTSGPVVQSLGDASTGVWGDYDNDGRLDLYVTNWGTPTANDYLYLNIGEGDFLEILTSPMVDDNSQGVGAAWADYDRDGWLDLFVANSLNQPNFLYQNRGDGTFHHLATDPVGTSRGTSIGCAWGDYDNDGDPDLVVGNAFEGLTETTPAQNDFLFRNDGDGEFTAITSGPVVTDGARGGAPAWGDYDNDGDLDLVIINGYGENDRLYRNDGQGNFIFLSGNRVSMDGQRGSGCAWGDYDNDGWLDLFVTGGIPSVTAPGARNRLFRNLGDGEFEQIAVGAIANEGPGSLGAAWGDYDNDGFLDLFVANTGDTEPNPISVHMNNYLYRNQGNSNCWLLLKLVGTASNRSAIGAKVRIRATIGGRDLWQLREISGGSGYCSQNDPRAHFGLGDATNAQLVRIEWPSGQVQELRDVAVNRLMNIKEPPLLTALGLATDGAFHFSLRGGIGEAYVIEQSTNLIHWSQFGTLTTTEFHTPILDSDVASAPGRFYRALRLP